MDIIFLHGLRIETVIGVYNWERDIRQPVVFDIDMGTDIRRSAAKDDIKEALDYKTIAKRLIQFVENSRFQLVETLAEQCATILLNEFTLTWVRLKVNKIGAITGAQDVGVIIERGQRQVLG
ncbi:dihydroneopterin aldolase [Achromatium sp. WMS1]|nr:dihydroneopterin aldolase [Achromatium sp. WMS1]